jgi:hypothetical protein
MAAAVALLAPLSVAAAGESVVVAALAAPAEAVSPAPVTEVATRSAPPAVAPATASADAVAPSGRANETSADRAMASAARPAPKPGRVAAATRRAVPSKVAGTCSPPWCGRHFVLMLGVAY